MRCVPAICVLSLLAACGSDSNALGSGPTIYVALDQQFSEPVLQGFADELGIDLKQKHDAENNKTVGHVTRILEDKDNQRCSVFWNNEIAHTVSLAAKGMLEPYDSPSAKDVPARWRDKDHRWTAFAARARILIVNTELVPNKSDWPTSYKDLSNPKWKGKCAIAKPKNGTTLTHFCAMWKGLGDDGMKKWIEDMQKNDVQFLSSNGATMRAVRDGNLAFAFTDTDDFHVAKMKGFPVTAVFPDQGDGEIGTMLIPNSVALIKNGPDQENAKRLIDKILARETEALLATADSAQIPLREGIAPPPDKEVRALGQFREMQWDIEWTGKQLAAFDAKFGKVFGL